VANPEANRTHSWRSRLQRPALITAVTAGLAPALAIPFGGPAIWVVTTLLLTLAIYACGTGVRAPGLRVAFVTAAMFFVLIGNLLLGASYYLQATGFNRAFFDHLNFNTIHALPVYERQAVAAFAYLLGATWLSAWGAKRIEPRPFAWWDVALLTLALVLFAPLAQVIRYTAAQSRAAGAARPLDGVLAAASPIWGEPQRPPKNLVLIYMEGLEQTYFDVLGLMPRLTELRTRMTRFTNVHEMVGSTIGGLVSTMCGWPPFPDLALYRSSQFLPGLRCIGDELADRGYQSTFMGGARVTFTRKDTLFGTHGFSKVLGAKALLPKLPDPEYRNKWGLHDDSLFDLAKAEFDSLSQRESPFALVLLTLGTHVPGYVAPSCPTYEGSDHLVLQAVHCTDEVVAGLVEHIRASEASDDTVIAIVSDHLMWKGIRSQGLTTPDKDRRMTFLLDVAGEPGRDVAAAGSEVDVGPTLAEAIGLSLGSRLGLGSSLLSGQGFLWTAESGLDGNKESIRAFVHSDDVRAVVRESRQPSDSE